MVILISSKLKILKFNNPMLEDKNGKSSKGFWKVRLPNNEAIVIKNM